MAKKFMYVCLGILALAVAFHLGAQYGEGTTQSQEIVLDTGLIYDGDPIPLPFYADATQAAECKCTWVAIPTSLKPQHGETLGFDCFAHGSPYRVLQYRHWTVNGTFRDNVARYLMIAVRGSSPTVTRSTTWGQIKAEFE